MALNKKHLTLLALVTLTTGVSLRMGSILGDGSAFDVAGEGSSSSHTPVYDTVQVIINKFDLGSTINTSKITQDLYTSSEDALNDFPDDSTRWFDYMLTTRLASVRSSWFYLYPNLLSDTPFQSLYASGSNTNKFRLINLTMSLSTFHETTVGQLVDINLQRNNEVASFILGSYTSTTVSTNTTTLNANSITFNRSFSFNDNIQEFSILPSATIAITSMEFTYQIDYATCPLPPNS